MQPDQKERINFIDVGSAGDLPKPWSQHNSIIGQCLRFEPREQSLDANDILSLDTMLWEKEEERNFFIYRGFNGTGSSLFLQNYDYVLKNFETLKTRGPKHFADTWLERSLPVDVKRVFCRPLDSVLKELDLPYRFHFMKIDAQGAEYQILKGSENFLKNDCYGLQVELFELPLYKSIKLINEVIDYLKTLNFKLVKKLPPDGTFDSQNDCIFIKNDLNDRIMAEIRRVYGLPGPKSQAYKTPGNNDVLQLIRLGNEAFGKKCFQDAAKHYRQALTDNTLEPEKYTDVIIALGKCYAEQSKLRKKSELAIKTG